MIVKLARGSYDPADLWVGPAREVELADVSDLVGLSEGMILKTLLAVEEGARVLFCSTLGQRLEVCLP